MSNKITGSDLERLLKEAMGLKFEVETDDETEKAEKPKVPVEEIEEKARLALVNISNIEAVKKLDDS